MAQILIVEDQGDIADALALLLQSEGHAATPVAHGEAALQRLREERPPDVILLDLGMPVMDGYEFRRRQLAEPRLAGIPVIVLTANTRVRDREGLRAHAIFTKPVDFAVLCDAIDACLRARAATP